MELAKLFAADNNHVVLVARSTDKLNTFADELRNRFQVDAHVISCDLAQPNSVEQLVNQLKNMSVQIDYLVNNAGFGAVGDVAVSARNYVLESLVQ